MNKSIGRYPDAYCIVSDGSLLISGETREFGPEFGHDNETVGCGVKPNGQLFFTLNGQMLGQSSFCQFIIKFSFNSREEWAASQD
jgi:hypothetical protein